MSAHEMNIPAGYEYYRRTELVATAPGHWPGLTEIQQMPQSKAKKYAWLIEAIKNTARRPFYTNSWVGIGHTTQARSTPQGTDELRSEEHTSELQSRFDLVCRLLLEKKKYN